MAMLCLPASAANCSSNSSSDGDGDGIASSAALTCEEGDLLQNGQLGLEAVAAVEAVSLVILVGLARLIRRHVETNHPVYAVLFQNSVLLATVQSVNFVFFVVAMAWDKGFSDCSLLPVWSLAEAVIVTVAAVFNSVSWLVVNALRYYFIVMLGPGDESPDLQRTRRRSLGFVWTAFFFQFALTGLTTFSALWLNGFPAVRFAQMSLGARATVVISSFLAATMPDLASIIVYLLIRRHVLITERESAGEGEGEGGEPPFGGIYVGESSSNEAMELSDLEGSAPAAAAPAPDTAPAIVKKDLDSKEMRAVLLALKSYATSCLFDTVFMLLPRHLVPPDSRFNIAIHASFLQILVMWLPAALMALNFGPIRGVFSDSAGVMRGALSDATRSWCRFCAGAQVGPDV